MEDREFRTLTRALVEDLLPRIPQDYVDDFEGTLVGGEFGIALENLVYTVVEYKVRLSDDEAETMRRVVEDLPVNERPALLKKLEHLVVTPNEEP